MTKENSNRAFSKRAQQVVEAMQEKKGRKIAVLDLTEVGHAVTDYFIVCSVGSDSQMDAVAEEVEKQLWDTFEEEPWQKEGFQEKSWVVLDYVDVVVHIFKETAREKYKLEQLWGDAPIHHIADPDAQPTNERQIRF